MICCLWNWKCLRLVHTGINLISSGQSWLKSKKASRTLITLPHGILAVGAGISCSGRAPLLLAMCTTFTECYFVPMDPSYYVHCMLGALATGARASLGNIPLTNHLSCKGTVAAIYGSQRETFVEAEADF